MTEWQTIENCPSPCDDVGLVWVFGGTYYKVPTLVKPDGGWWRAMAREQHCLDTIPTHWMPLEIPHPPTT